MRRAEAQGLCNSWRKSMDGTGNRRDMKGWSFSWVRTAESGPYLLLHSLFPLFYFIFKDLFCFLSYPKPDSHSRRKNLKQNYVYDWAAFALQWWGLRHGKCTHLQPPKYQRAETDFQKAELQGWLDLAEHLDRKEILKESGKKTAKRKMGQRLWLADSDGLMLVTKI